jgi:hypothetical protein
MKLAMALTSGTQISAACGTTVPDVRGTGCLSGVVRHLLVFVVVLLAWQIALLIALLYGFIELDVYLGLHFASCLAWAVWSFRGSSAAALDSPDFAPLQIIAWCAFAGPFGAFVAAALSFRQAPARSETISVNNVEILSTDRDQSKRVEHMHLALLDHRVRLKGADHIRPLIDVIAEGSRSEKLEALGVLYRRYGAELGAVLKRALKDPDTSVRVLAATVVAKLHATFGRRIGDCQAATDSTPNVAQSWRNIADARFAYADSGLLEGQRARAEIEFAIGDLLRADEIDPDDRETRDRLEIARRRLAALKL